MVHVAVNLDLKAVGKGMAEAYRYFIVRRVEQFFFENGVNATCEVCAAAQDSINITGEQTEDIADEIRTAINNTKLYFCGKPWADAAVVA